MKTEDIISKSMIEQNPVLGRSKSYPRNHLFLMFASISVVALGSCMEKSPTRTTKALRPVTGTSGKKYQTEIESLKCAKGTIKKSTKQKDDVSASCERSNGIKHGPFVSLHQNGKPRERGSFRTGKRDGIWRSWYSNGVKRAEGPFANGKRHGRWIEWTKDGSNLRAGSFDAGNKHGVWTEWRGQRYWLLHYLRGHRYMYDKLRFVGWASDGASVITEGRAYWNDREGEQVSIVEICRVPKPCDPPSRCRVLCGPCKQKAENLSEVRALNLIPPSQTAKVYNGADDQFETQVPNSNRNLRVKLVQDRQQIKSPQEKNGTVISYNKTKGVQYWTGAQHYGLFLDEEKKEASLPFAVFEISDFGFEVHAHFLGEKPRATALKIDRHLGDGFYLPVIYPLAFDRSDKKMACSSWLPSPYKRPPPLRYLSSPEKKADKRVWNVKTPNELKEALNGQLYTLGICFDLGELADKPKLPARLRLEVGVSQQRAQVKVLRPPTGSTPFEQCIRQTVATWRFSETKCKSYRIATDLEVQTGGKVKLLGKPMIGRDRDRFFEACDLPDLPH